MYLATYSVLFSLLMNGCVFASPIAPGDLSTRAQPTDWTALIAANVSSLSASNPPWGPTYFTLDKVMPSSPVEGLDVYMAVINIIAKLALNGWEDRLPIGMNWFSSSEYPEITVSAKATSNRARLPQKYLLWALARITNELITESPSGAGIYALLVQGRKVGEVLLLSGPLGPPISAEWTVDLVSSLDSQMNEAATPTTLNQTDNSVGTVDLTDTDLTWTFTFLEEEFLYSDVLMGTIGALICGAEQHSHGGIFIGQFPHYKAIYVFIPVVLDVFTKPVILDTVVKMVTRAHTQSNWHHQKMVLMNGTVDIASGGYTDFSPETITAGNLTLTS